MSKILGIDWGEAKIGLAIGSTEVGVATPYKIIKNDTRVMDAIKEVCQENGVETIVIGRLREKNKKLDKFIESLKSLGFSIELEDERLTTKMVQRAPSARLRTSSRCGSGRKFARGQDDAAAASLILQSWLERKKP